MARGAARLLPWPPASSCFRSLAGQRHASPTPHRTGRCGPSPHPQTRPPSALDAEKHLAG
ncbi:hypothetical protein FKP32DRAFT_1587643 [Trametes sanguinea]|nr:hypothetical protein FKP32DRAFT_1587643 [Trametes sanguinea]